MHDQQTKTARSGYITKEGFRALKQELDQLWRVERRAVTKALAEAAAEGDRSENAEYIYRKKQLREMDRRIRYLSKRVEAVKVVHDLPSDRTRVFFGAWVELLYEDDTTKRFRIVGSDEIDAKRGYISVDSPVARCILGKGIGDEVDIRLPESHVVVEIASVSYAE